MKITYQEISQLLASQHPGTVVIYEPASKFGGFIELLRSKAYAQPNPRR